MSLVHLLSGRPATAPQENSARRWNTTMVVLPTVVILIAGWNRRWISDDGLIFTRTVRQILAGHGPVYNVGERAEASTSTLWQWILVAFGWVTQMDVGRLAVLLGLLCTAAGYALALDGTRRLHTNALLLPVGVLIPLALPPVWDFATSGLETGLSTLWAGACWWLLVHTLDSQSKKTSYALAVLAGLGPMVRPDAAIASVGFLAAAWFTLRPRWTSLLAHAAAAVAVPLAYEIFRMGYYGVLLPLPAITKEASTSDWGRGRTYLEDLSAPYALWLPLVLLVIFLVTTVALRLRAGEDLRSKRLAVLVMPVVCGVVMTAYVMRVGGDFMHGRMLLPGLFMLLLPVLLLPADRLVLPLAAVTVVWAVVCAVALRIPYVGVIGDQGIADERGFYRSQTKTDHPTTADSYLRNFPKLPEAVRIAQREYKDVIVYSWHDGFSVTPLRPGLTYPYATLWPNLGVNGAAAPLDSASVDVLGLAYPLAAHVELTKRGRPGHEKEIDIAWVFAEYTDKETVLPPGVDPLRVAAARYALTCGPLKELQDSAREPMTWGRFWDNLTGSVERTTFRFPNDPLQAMQKICGVKDVPEEYKPK
jgi:arabinofuranosyltransferase